MTREQIERCLASADEGAELTKALCTLALEGLELRAEHSDPVTALAQMWTAAIKEELEQYKIAHDALRAENERLRSALQYIFQNSEEGWVADYTSAALERKPE